MGNFRRNDEASTGLEPEPDLPVRHHCGAAVTESEFFSETPAVSCN